ncbi:hypothetical protein P4N68_03680 [Corynebacterium felinum]|uniref:Transposase DDE domain-containing protein n=1 Tax=Corynebacterium felinum TaxID=131318 RepID=A0ABU2B6M1_9CORY|nr:hypothetical protein [Corynebacterium felinum]MDF5820184.1 hypothetical protein [Corynebacterium felinum]MDR7353936.1 hypothetical protein [Corynebacterium felinum]WJY96109.1 hypothetical protein CFELI_12645 [Corynebacterium felinum]
MSRAGTQSFLSWRPWQWCNKQHADATHEPGAPVAHGLDFLVLTRLWEKALVVARERNVLRVAGRGLGIVWRCLWVKGSADKFSRVLAGSFRLQRVA